MIDLRSDTVTRPTAAMRKAMADAEVASLAVGALSRLLAPSGPMRELRLERVDRVPPAESLLAGALRGIGFRPSYRAWLLRP